MAIINSVIGIPLDDNLDEQTFTLPATPAGRLLVLHAGANDNVELLSATGFTRIAEDALGGNARTAVFVRIADSSVNGTNTTTLTTSGVTKESLTLVTVDEWGGSLSSLQITAIVMRGQGNPITPNPITPTWATPNTLYLQLVAIRTGGGGTTVTHSTGWTPEGTFATPSASGGATTSVASFVSSDATVTPGDVSISDTDTAWGVFILAIRDQNTDFGITSATDGPLRVGDQLTLEHQNGDASGKTVTINGSAVSLDSESAEQTVITIPDFLDLGFVFGSVDIVITNTSNGQTDTISREIAVPVGFEQVTVTELGGIYASRPEFSGLQEGHTVYAQSVQSDDGISADFATGSIPANRDFEFRAHNGASWFLNLMVLGVDVGNTADTPATGSISISGTPEIGQVLTADTSQIVEPDGISNTRYQWLRGVTPIGTDSQTYTVVELDAGEDITVRVTITDTLTNDTIFTSPAVTIATPSDSVAAGTVSINGTLSEGSVLTANTSLLTDGDGIASFTYQWLRDGSDIAGATSSTYTTVSADVGPDISVRVTLEDNNTNTYNFTSPTVTVTAVVVVDPGNGEVVYFNSKVRSKIRASIR